MSFERQSEKEPLGPAFLEEQIRLPRSEWDERFRNLIEEKIQERQLPEEVREESPEREQERSFERYLKGLGLNEDALKDKKILDLGSGDGEFVRSLIEKGITKDAYGIDVAVDEITLNEKFKGHLLKSDFEHKADMGKCKPGCTCPMCLKKTAGLSDPNKDSSPMMDKKEDKSDKN